jgi:hypothetical protein
VALEPAGNGAWWEIYARLTFSAPGGKVFAKQEVFDIMEEGTQIPIPRRISEENSDRVQEMYQQGIEMIKSRASYV